LYRKALRIAQKAHKGQVDKGGNSYIDHPKKVASMVKTKEARVVAILHDVCEDTDVTLSDLVKYGFSDKIVDAVDAITMRKDEDYLDYITRVKSNSIASEVKIADASHNSDLSRIKNPTTEDIERSRRYEKTIKRLKGLM
jgi:GTP diphosphokinase / guanosine-3',5'-bis(diphosphate) 3'-diphosphatase